MPFADIENRLARLEEMTRNIIRVGTVASTDPATGTARVQVPDADGLVSYDLPILQRQTLKNKDYAMPDPGEQVLCAFLPFGIEQGFVVGAMFSQVDTTPVQDQDKRHLEFEDGSWVQYDRKAHLLQAHVEQGALRVSVGKDAAVILEEGKLIVRAAKADIDIDTEKVLNLRGKDQIKMWTNGGTVTVPYEKTTPPVPEK